MEGEVGVIFQALRVGLYVMLQDVVSSRGIISAGVLLVIQDFGGFLRALACSKCGQRFELERFLDRLPPAFSGGAPRRRRKQQQLALECSQDLR